jgi:predicted RNA-binding Zn ribbon-like protein
LRLQTERLCLDFANTVNWHASRHPVDDLPTYEALVEWAERVGLLSEQRAEHLRREAGRWPEEAAAVLDRAQAAREAIYQLLSARAHGRSASPEAMATLNEAMSEALSHARLRAAGDGFAWDWSGANPEALDQMLWPVVQSAVDLMTSPELERVGQCADDRGCGWLFVDTTKNRSRRWCDMRDCGNRAKARRHYAKKKSIGG